ncbi:MAG TPA: histidine kinase [Pyrinomonadaceae bacterium]|nr:histidine kinase [Pyrinomonadaceae bacterium]
MIDNAKLPRVPHALWAAPGRPRHGAPSPVEPVDARLVGLMRVILAASALVVIYIDPAEPDRLVPLTYTALGLYTAYSLTLYVLAVRRPELIPVRYVHWVDAAWYLLFISLSSGTNSIFFIFLFFAILVASFRLGFGHGLAVTLVAASAFTLLGYLTTPAPLFDWNRFMLRPVSMLVLGYMIAYWGGLELTFKRRLGFLKEVNRLSNPRFGVDQTISSLMERLRNFYNADSCVLIVPAHDSEDYFIRKSERDQPDNALRALRMPAVALGPLVSLPLDQVVIYNCPKGRLSHAPRYVAVPVRGADGERGREGLRAARQLAEVLGGSFISLPLNTSAPRPGRFYLVCTEGTFDVSDVDFLLQVGEQVQPVVENIQLLDNLATEAAEQEREKISRDIHDSTVQPYIGFKMALESFRRKLPGDGGLASEIDELIGKVDEGVADLRRIIRGLRSKGGGSGDTLVESIRRQAQKLTAFYGIQIDVRAEGTIRVNDRLAAEVFQLVREGLSNVRRHTTASRAVISLRCLDSHLFVRIENDGTPGAPPFVPGSITGRVESVGGRTAVEVAEDGYTVVSIEIPI